MQARDLARKAGIAGTAGSDAHIYSEVGRTVVRLAEFHDAAGLRSALPSAQILARPSLPWVHLLSNYASMRRRVEKAGKA